VSKLGPDLFGDKTNLYNGKLEFIQVDVSLPGNNALPVGIARHLETGIQPAAHYGRPFGLWDLDIPHIYGIFSAKDGFVPDPKTGGRCSNFGPPPLAVGVNNIDAFDPIEFWPGTFLYIPGIGDQQLLIRQTGATIPLAPGPASQYPIVTTKFWYASCLANLKNGSGQGFLVLAPDGTTYQFDQIVSYRASTLSKSTSLSALTTTTEADTSSDDPSVPDALPGKTTLSRQEVWLLRKRQPSTVLIWSPNCLLSNYPG
jgi:hypothetical protein